jgi:hypothetical protein
VLVIDAGHDVVNVNTTIPFYLGRAVEGGFIFCSCDRWILTVGFLHTDPQLELNYTYDEFSPGAKFPRDDAWWVPNLRLHVTLKNWAWAPQVSSRARTWRINGMISFELDGDRIF